MPTDKMEGDVRISRARLWFLIAILLGVSTGSVSLTRAHQDSQPRSTVTIRGSIHPELIPQHIVWLFFFSNFVTLAKLEAPPGQLNDARVSSLARYELRISVDETRLFLQIADRAISDYHSLMALGANEPDPERKNGRFTEAASAIIAARDELAFRLPRNSFEAVKRRAAVTARRTSIDIPIR